MTTSPPDDLIGLGEASRIVQVSRATLWRWVRAGRLRGWRVAGHRIRVSRGDVEALVVEVATSVTAVTEKAERQEAARQIIARMERDGVLPAEAEE